MANTNDQEIEDLLEELSDSDFSSEEQVKVQRMDPDEIDKLLEEFEKDTTDPNALRAIKRIKETKNTRQRPFHSYDDEKDAEETEETEGSYQLPIKGGKILSHFATKEQAMTVPGAVASLARHPGGHEAIDVIVPGFDMKNNSGMGEPVYPIGPGTVIKVNSSIGENIKGGITCTIQHSSDTNLTSYYAHLSKLNVSVGTKVNTSTVIGLNGDTGSAKGTSPHVHLSTTLNGKRVDPMGIIGKPFGSLSKRASFYLRLYKAAEYFEEIIKKHC